MKKAQTFDDAFQKLLALVNEIEDDKIMVDTLAEKIASANELILFCETRLRDVEQNISPTQNEQQ